jgi:hypothetical protein
MRVIPDSTVLPVKQQQRFDIQAGKITITTNVKKKPNQLTPKTT